MAEELDAPEGTADNDAVGLFAQLQRWYRADIRNVREWRKDAREDWNFYNGDQWSAEDRQALRDSNRPELTLNRIGPLINAIVGSEINNRREARFFPREEGDAIASEVLTAAAEWFRDEGGAEDQESDAFKAVSVCGMGWTDTRLDFDGNPDGSPIIDNVDEFEMVWDNNAQKPNLADATRMFRVRQVSYKEASELTGVKERERLHAAWAKESGTTQPHDQEEADDYTGTQSGNIETLPPKCTLVEARWFEREAYYRIVDPSNPDNLVEVGEDQFRMAKALAEKQGVPLQYARQTRKVLRRAFLGSEILGKVDKPMVPSGFFGWECITGYRDKVQNRWYGVVRAAKDPARWANKFFSQVMHLLNSQAKGGVLAERGAFENDRQAESSWAKADEVTWVKPGAISGERPKIMPKAPAQFPAGFFSLFQETKESISEVTGLSMEFIGTREVDQAGVLEYQRRQSSLNLLAELFNSLRRYRKRQGRIMLHLIQEHLADGRLVKIVGDDNAQYVRLTKSDVANREYDIIIDDSPSSPNEKDRSWQIITQMLPIIRDMLTPDIVLEFMSMSPLPASVVEKLKRKAAEQQQMAQQQPSPEEQAMMLEQQKGQIEIAGKEADLQFKQASGAMDIEMKQAEMAMAYQKAQLDAQVAARKAQTDMGRLAIAERQNAIRARNAGSRRTSAASR